MTEQYTPRTILLAEDDADDRMLAIRALQQDGGDFDVKAVWDGEELMDYLNQRGEYTDAASAPRPVLILLDLNMPRKDGREALQEIKSDPRFRSIPVVVLTTSGADVDVQRSYDTGVNAYITKPVKFSELAEVMNRLVQFWFDTATLPSENEA